MVFSGFWNEFQNNCSFRFFIPKSINSIHTYLVIRFFLVSYSLPSAAVFISVLLQLTDSLSHIFSACLSYFKRKRQKLCMVYAPRHKQEERKRKEKTLNYKIKWKIEQKSYQRKKQWSSNNKDLTTLKYKLKKLKQSWIQIQSWNWKPARIHPWIELT